MSVDERIKQVRSFFSENLSLHIFDKRVEIGKDVKKEMFPETLVFTENAYHSGEELAFLVSSIRDTEQEIWIYGAGVGCQALLRREAGKVLAMRNLSGIIDNHITGERYGYPILSFQDFLKQYRNAIVLNSVGIPAGKDIHRQCVDAGVDVISLFELDKSWDQYFDLPAELGLMDDHEVFVHGGCYNGDTQKSYRNWFGNRYEKMITFEPNAAQYAFCRNLFKDWRDVELVQAGLSDKTGTVKFDLDLPGRSFISETGTEEIKTVSLDEYMNGGKVTFIALDIEGEEYKALKGAEQIIRAQKPKLAISIYHKPEDIYELPELVKSFRPDYKLYLRHYHLLDMAETVMYAF